MKKVSWLKNALIYNVYPQSFFDTDGDGIGDLKGVEQKLDYIKSLGCNTVWMNPIFESPFRDAGYDITDFYKIAARYGTKEDLISLCAAAKKRDMHIILDLVAGHTSLECEWFKRSCEYDRNEYSDRYVWTNAVGVVGDGSYIKGYSERDGAYMSNFYYCQPALNYGFAKPTESWQQSVDSPPCVDTQNELLKIMDYWIDLGVDGFRVDMAYSLVKGDADGSATVALWQRLTGAFKQKHPECILMSEWSYPERSLAGGFDIDFLIHFNLKPFTTLFRHEKGRNCIDDWIGKSYFRKEGEGDFSLFYEDFIDQREKTGGLGYISLPIGSHDLCRISFERDSEDLKVIFAFALTLPGIPLIYYGDEIGMRYLEGLRSVEGGYHRTGSRTPMQWESGKNFGFSTSDKPYIVCDSSPDAPTVFAQEKDENSLLNLVKRIVEIRKAHPALQEDGEFRVISKESYPAVYERSLENEKIRVIINPAAKDFVIDCNRPKEVYIAHNVEFKENKAQVGKRSFAIFKIS